MRYFGILALLCSSAQAFSSIQSSSVDRAFNTRLFDTEIPDGVPSSSSQKQHLLMGFDEHFVLFPHREFSAAEVVELCMDGLQMNELPYSNAGLEICWNFSSDRCRAAQGRSLDNFISHAANPVFQTLVNSRKWKVKSLGPLIPKTQTRGAMRTVLVQVTSRNGRKRDFLWTLQQERRPPNQGCWLVHECIARDNAYQLTL